ncbi:TusA-related sulfurtransferase [Desulfobotulus alkaliphilus]|uniref:TusA-related sulfurtransferase n=1 Tax=Desulfobotulus alkaliphilus TaxID=622671 RepID=A0A562S2N3_9BACT|nr:sulfurtransferase TusA family protein [Desulfobotulus alkaliphilus]TWI75612.1 TusA-related sulfurtransferase [Desulfobotulus alkaliphilus]
MTEILDERGLSCPQPVLDTLKTLPSVQGGKLSVLVDTEAARENVARAAESKGWQLASVDEKDGDYTLHLVKKS